MLIFFHFKELFTVVYDNIKIVIKNIRASEKKTRRVFRWRAGGGEGREKLAPKRKTLHSPPPSPTPILYPGRLSLHAAESLVQITDGKTFFSPDTLYKRIKYDVLLLLRLARGKCENRVWPRRFCRDCDGNAIYHPNRYTPTTDATQRVCGCGFVPGLKFAIYTYVSIYNITHARASAHTNAAKSKSLADFRIYTNIRNIGPTGRSIRHYRVSHPTPPQPLYNGFWSKRSERFEHRSRKT